MEELGRYGMTKLILYKVSAEDYYTKIRTSLYLIEFQSPVQ
jgi:hypothetical protein